MMGPLTRRRAKPFAPIEPSIKRVEESCEREPYLSVALQQAKFGTLGTNTPPRVNGTSSMKNVAMNLDPLSPTLPTLVMKPCAIGIY